MIPPHVLTILMWSVIGVWSITGIAVLTEFHRRARRDARAAALLQRLTADTLNGDRLPDVTPSQFQELLEVGLPASVEINLARDVHARVGDEKLVALATGAARGSVEERIQALHVVTSGRHPEMYQVLARALHGEGEVAAVALRLLKALDDDRAVETLIEALAEGAYSASRIAAALDRMSAERATHLGPLLQHSSVTVRFWGLLLAGRTGATHLTWTVRGMLTDREPMIRRAAVEALGRLGSPDDRRLILARFFDPSAMVRVHAARAAARFEDEGVAEGLVKLLGDREWIVRAAARDTLRALGEVATAAVTRMLWQGDPFAANNAAEVLFYTGQTDRMVHDLLSEPQKYERRRLVERLLSASGPQIVRAVNDHLDPAQQTELERLVKEQPEVLPAVKKR